MELNEKTIVEFTKDNATKAKEYSAAYKILQVSGLANIDHASDANANVLKFINNGILTIKAGVFDKFKWLQTLNLSQNFISTLPKGIFHSLSQLKFINLDQNHITELHVNLFRENKKLECINIRDNKLTALDDEIFNNLPELQELSFGTNKIETFDFQCLKNSPKLKKLMFAHANLSEINTLNNLKKHFPLLHYCSVSGNQFTCTYLKTVIQSLELQNIKIGFLDKSKGINYNSVYGLKCIPDDIYPATHGTELEEKHLITEEEIKRLNEENARLQLELANGGEEFKKLNEKNIEFQEQFVIKHQEIQHLSDENSKLRDDLSDTNRKLEDMLEMIRELQQKEKSVENLKDIISDCELEIERIKFELAKQEDEKKTYYANERPIIFGKFGRLDKRHEQLQRFQQVLDAKLILLQNGSQMPLNGLASDNVQCTEQTANIEVKSNDNDTDNNQNEELEGLNL